MRFDPALARSRVESLWKLSAFFGVERQAFATYLDELVSDRFALVNGLQLLRDELQFAGARPSRSDLAACGADFALPSVVTTLAATNCGDRVHQGEATTNYEHVVGSRFASMSEIGELKIESFSPTGGGVDDGATLAHVTVAHQLDEGMRESIYRGNASSFVLTNFDIKTHVGRLDGDGTDFVFGKTQEAPWREPRAACGAIVGTLTHYNDRNGVHRRIRHDLGEENFAFLSANRVVGTDGIDITYAVAGAIVSIAGMRTTLRALARELDERGVGHVTASVTVNRVSRSDTLIYLARGTIFGDEIRMQGLGTDATKYSGRMIERHGDPRLVLTYEGHEGVFPVVSERCQRDSGHRTANWEIADT